MGLRGRSSPDFLSTFCAAGSVSSWTKCRDVCKAGNTCDITIVADLKRYEGEPDLRFMQ